MIKTSGYRVSPTEVEEAVYGSPLVADVVAFAAPHAALGEGIVLVAAPGIQATGDAAANTAALLNYCRQQLPGFMVPHHIAWLGDLPRNPNGKFDRPALATQFRDVFGTAR